MSLEQRLREIEERAAKATPGPWRWRDAHETDVYPFADGLMDMVGDGDQAVLQEHCPDYSSCAGINVRLEDADFIAHARMDVPYLLSVVRTLAAAVEALCGLIHASETELTLRSFPLDELKRVRMAVDRATVLLRTGEVPQDGPATPTATPPG